MVKNKKINCVFCNVERRMCGTFISPMTELIINIFLMMFKEYYWIYCHKEIYNQK